MSNLIRKSVQALTAYTPGEQPDDPGVIKLNTNENAYPPPPVVGERLRSMDSASLKLYPNPVSGSLRKRIAEIHGCASDEVLLGNGSDEVLALCTRAFVENDGSIGYFDPSYSLYPVMADIRDVEKRPVWLGEEFEWRMPEGYSCSLFFLANPNAPTGVLYPKEIVSDFCSSFDGIVVIDEAYVEFSSRHCVELAMEFDNVLVVRTLSKSCSLAGLRLGYALGNGELVCALHKVKDSYNLGAIPQLLGLAALSDDGLAHVRENVRRIKDSRERLKERLAALGHKVYPSETNFVWIEPSAMEAGELFQRLKDQGILVRYFPGERTGTCIRITVGTDEEIDKLFEAMSEIEAKGNEV
jgi:histidinol-phosphate aminotransferase